MNIKQQIYEQGYSLSRGKYNWLAQPIEPILGHSIKAKSLEDILKIILCIKGEIYV